MKALKAAMLKAGCTKVVVEKALNDKRGKVALNVDEIIELRSYFNAINISEELQDYFFDRNQKKELFINRCRVRLKKEVTRNPINFLLSAYFLDTELTRIINLLLDKEVDFATVQAIVKHNAERRMRKPQKDLIIKELTEEGFTKNDIKKLLR